VVAAARPPRPDLKPEEQDEIDEPEPAKAAPKIPTKASVAKQATFKNAINLSKINLIGTYGTESKRYALVRQANGRYKKVKVGDKIDGGTVKAITANEVRYQKGGKLLSLKMPKARRDAAG
jgi:type IV pilus biogenesis protein PilP